MGINFPNTPTVGTLYPSPPVVGQPVYRWDGEKWSVQSLLAKQPIYTDGSVPMTAQLTLVAPPVAPTDAAAKSYVDAGVASGIAAKAVRYDAAQALGSGQLIQARQNIYAAPGDAMSYSGIQVNGSMEVSQRFLSAIQTLVSGTPRYIADCTRAVYFHNAATAVITAYQGPNAPAGFANYMQMTAGSPMSAPGAGDQARFAHAVEGWRCARLGWGIAGVSCPLTACFFFYSSVAGTFAVNVRNSASDRSYAKECVYPVANTWSYYKVTIPPPSSGAWLQGGGMGLDFAVTLCCGSNYQTPDGAWANGNFLGTPGTTNFFAANGNFAAITGLTLLPGNDGPPDWQSLANCQRPFAEEFIRCQRYYEKNFPYAVAPAQGVNVYASSLFPQPVAAAASGISPLISFKATKRITPTMTLYSVSNGSGQIRNVARGSDWTGSALNAADEVGFQPFGTTPGSSAVGDTCGINWAADASF